MSELIDQFNELKNLIYKDTTKKMSLSEIALLIKKKNKTIDELKILNSIKVFVKTMLLTVEDMGTKALELNYSMSIESESEGIEVSNNIEKNVKDILMLLDQYIDALNAMIRVYDYTDNRLNLKESEQYLRALRSKLIEKAHAYTSDLMQEEEDKIEIIHFLNDLIDTVAKTSYGLRLMKLNNALEKYI